MWGFSRNSRPSIPTLQFFMKNLELVVKPLGPLMGTPKFNKRSLWSMVFPHVRLLLQKNWASIFFIILWSIWKERNSRCFENKSCSLEQLHDLILLRTCWWISGWGEPFPYSPNEVLRNPLCLRSSHHHPAAPVLKQSKLTLMWSPPPHSCLKWNVDASLNLSLQKSAIGGVLRDHGDKFICIFSSPIPYVEINHAEVLAIHCAIKLFRAHEVLCSQRLVIESDSANTVKWCTGNSKGPWNLTFIISYIRQNLKMENGIDIIHKKRDSNVVADTLAKQGLARMDDFIAWL